MSEEEANTSNYDRLLTEARNSSEVTAKKYIPELYKILVEEESKTPDDARGIIEHDLKDIWSKITIGKHLPEEIKDEAKVKAGKKSAEEKKKKVLIDTSGNPVPEDSKVTDEKESNLNPDSQKEDDSVAPARQQNDPEPEPPEIDSRLDGKESPEVKGWEELVKENEELKEIANNALKENAELKGKEKHAKIVEVSDCTEHSMYKKSQELIKTLRLNNKDLEDRNAELDKIIFKDGTQVAGMFSVPTTPDFVNEHYYLKKTPMEAKNLIMQYRNDNITFEIAWRISQAEEKKK